VNFFVNLVIFAEKPVAALLRPKAKALQPYLGPLTLVWESTL